MVDNNLNICKDFFASASHTTYIFLPCLTDGAPKIFSYHLMLWPGFELTFVESAPHSKRGLITGPRYRLSYLNIGKYI